MTTLRQVQHHGPRAPSGHAEKTERLAARVSPAEKRKFDRRGGSEWLRKLIREAV